MLNDDQKKSLKELEEGVRKIKDWALSLDSNKYVNNYAYKYIQEFKWLL